MSWIDDNDHGLLPDEILPTSYWKTKDGKRMKPEEMTYTHREATIAMVSRKFGESYALEIPIIRQMYLLNKKLEGEQK